MIEVIRETFNERYEKYLNIPDSREFLRRRIDAMTNEEVAYLLAEHEKFHRIGCKEYECDDTDGERLPDPLGRTVDPWGRLIKTDK